MTRKEITKQLRAQDVPEEVAEEKYRAWRGGNIVALFGGFLAVVSLALVGLTIIMLRQMPGPWLLSFAALGSGGGLVFVYLGAHAASGEAMDAAGKSGSKFAGAIARAAAMIRRNGNA
jgi:hypothetical protein